jgi:hypothetical protein
MNPKTLAHGYGIHFTVEEVDEGGLPTLPTGQQGVPREQAIRAAMDTGLAGVDRAHMSNVEVSAQYGLFTDDRYGQIVGPGRQIRPYLQDRPAWVVTFSGPGVVLSSHGPPGSRRRVKHEANVVIDAATGQYLMGFS